MFPERLRPLATTLLPGLLAVALMVLWAVHNGGYDADTWYWGALLLLAMLATVIVGTARGRLRPPPRSARAPLLAFALYVGWSYLSIAWAQSPGDALQGSNRALMYLIVFALIAWLPWTTDGALAALVIFTIGVGVIALVILVRLASADHVARLVIDGRLAAPTGYLNSTAALFTMGSLTAIALAARRELPALARGALIATACATLPLALIGQSRGWLFTLPLVAVAAIAVVGDRLRVAVAALIPIAAVLAPLSRLLDVYKSQPGPALDHAAVRAGHSALLICAAAFVVGTLIGWVEPLVRAPVLSAPRRRALGAVAVAVTLAGGCSGFIAATHAHPVRFIQRQWHGFSHPSTSASHGSHFAQVGSGRYDFWRVSLDAVLAHPIGGLGQDNFADYYVTRRQTGEEPSWTHSLELRLLAHTGFVGLALFAAFLSTALISALRGIGDSGPLRRAVAGVCLLPLVVWVIHGSVDWFWEIPALTAPALGFLALAGALSGKDRAQSTRLWRRRVLRPLPAASSALTPPLRTLTLAACALVLVVAALTLGLPYLSVREVSLASDLRQSNPAAALRHLSTAADLNPLSADPARLAGTIALQSGRFGDSEQRFRQAIAREPGGWFSWFGDGLAASALGDSARAHHDFAVAAAINTQQSGIKLALARVYNRRPVTPAEGLQSLVLK